MLDPLTASAALYTTAVGPEPTITLLPETTLEPSNVTKTVSSRSGLENGSIEIFVFRSEVRSVFPSLMIGSVKERSFSSKISKNTVPARSMFELPPIPETGLSATATKFNDARFSCVKASPITPSTMAAEVIEIGRLIAPEK